MNAVNLQEWLLDRFIELYDAAGRHTSGLGACAREAIKLGAREEDIGRDQQTEAKIREIVFKVAEAQRLGGGFRMYFDTAVDELCALVKEGRPR